MAVPPRVSVFIASYNHASYLCECLDSILGQTFQDFEIVIVDDGSTDNSYAILKNYETQFPDKVRVFDHPGHANRGISATVNLAINKSIGEYLAWIGSDDVWYPEKLGLQVDYLENHPNAGLVYGYAHFIDSSSSLLPGCYGIDVTHLSNPLGSILVNEHVPPQTILVRRGCLDDVGIFDENLINSDWDLAIRIFARWEVGFVDRPLTKYRLHSTNVSKGIDPKILLQWDLKLYLAIQEKLPEIGGKLMLPRNQAILSLQIAFHQFCSKNFVEAEAYLSKAFQCDESLGDDLNFFNDWLNNWKPDFYDTTHCHFGLWVIDHLPEQISPSFLKQLMELQLNHPDTKGFFVRRGIDLDLKQDKPITGEELFNDWPVKVPLTETWKNQVMKAMFPELLFRNYKESVRAKLRFYWLRTIRSDPSWLKNRGVWSIGLRTLLQSAMIFIALH